MIFIAPERIGRRAAKTSKPFFLVKFPVICPVHGARRRRCVILWMASNSAPANRRYRRV
jgi:hypothetical protein